MLTPSTLRPLSTAPLAGLLATRWAIIATAFAVPILTALPAVLMAIFSAPVGESLFVPFDPRVVCSGEGVAYRVVMVRQRFFSQACLRSPGPPNFGLSRQFWHSPQSLRVQGTHWLHRCSVPRFLPDSVALDMALTAAAALLPLGA